MKKYFFLLLFCLPLSLFSQKEGVIELSNKKPEKQSNQQKEKKSTTQTGVPLFPKSIYIGELGNSYSDDINRNRAVSLVDRFLQSVSDNTEYSSLISNEFLFVFEEVYNKTFESTLISWLIGYPQKEGEIYSIEIELHFRNSLYTGYVYLDNGAEFIVDLQLDIEEEIQFDPSTPY